MTMFLDIATAIMVAVVIIAALASWLAIPRS